MKNLKALVDTIWTLNIISKVFNIIVIIIIIITFNSCYWNHCSAQSYLNNVSIIICVLLSTSTMDFPLARGFKSLFRKSSEILIFTAGG